jgi:hypothetical protein
MIDDTNEYGSGEQIACVVCKGQDHGFCAFAQYQGDYKITGATVKDKLKEIVAHGCKGRYRLATGTGIANAMDRLWKRALVPG